MFAPELLDALWREIPVEPRGPGRGPEAADFTMIRTETGSGTTLENRAELGFVAKYAASSP